MKQKQAGKPTPTVLKYLGRLSSLPLYEWFILHVYGGMEQTQVFLLGVAIRHARQVIADHALDRVVLPAPGEAQRQQFRLADKFPIQGLQNPPALLLHPQHSVMLVYVFVEEIF